MCGGRTTLRDEFSQATVRDQDVTVTGVGKGVSSRPQEEVLRTKGDRGQGYKTKTGDRGQGRERRWGIWPRGTKDCLWQMAVYKGMGETLS